MEREEGKRKSYLLHCSQFVDFSREEFRHFPPKAVTLCCARHRQHREQSQVLPFLLLSSSLLSLVKNKSHSGPRLILPGPAPLLRQPTPLITGVFTCVQRGIPALLHRNSPR